MAKTRENAVEFYWRPGCTFCIMLRARLSPTKLPLREVKIWEDPTAAAKVRSVAGGNETGPTVLVGDRAMVNPSAKEVLAAVREHAPGLLPPEQPRSAPRKIHLVVLFAQLREGTKVPWGAYMAPEATVRMMLAGGNRHS